MPSILKWNSALTISVAALLSTTALAGRFSIADGDLKDALNAYSAQSGQPLLVSTDAVRGIRGNGVRGDFSNDSALSRILVGTGFVAERQPGGAIAIIPVHQRHSSADDHVTPLLLAQASPNRSAVETVTVTSSKIGGSDVQSIPIAITALSQEQLTATQTAGGPDLVKQVPNLTFTKTNFTGYSIQIRGIGTQAISVTTDPAVAVAFNDVPFLRNHFFEQEFFDVSQVEVLRGPQGTLYGRNATAGVVNVTSAKPTDQFEAMASADIGNYKNRRFEGMINIPLVDDRLDLRLAGEWTKRKGYSVNELSGESIDGRDLWSGRLSVQVKPSSNVQSDPIWEHFQENDDRMRSAKQLCEAVKTPTEIAGVPIPPIGPGSADALANPAGYLSQGCQLTSLYSDEAFQVPNGFSLPFILALSNGRQINPTVDPYASTTQSRDLRVIESTSKPIYKAKSDIAELNTDYNVTPTLILTSQTGYGGDSLYSVEDYNRFNTAPGIFSGAPDEGTNFVRPGAVSPEGVFCDPQLGCTDRLAGVDLSEEHAWQLSQEFRLASNFSGPLNFSVGGNYLHYETEENYYVIINAFTLAALLPASIKAHGAGTPYIPNISPNNWCLDGLQQPDPTSSTQATLPCSYIDPNPLSSINGQGHNYYRSYNPYVLNSYAGFGEAYYNLFDNLKITAGLRWTDDEKHFIRVPSEILIVGAGYPSLGPVNQNWGAWTGRMVANWTPKLGFTDQTLIYGSFAHGYKAGGANPPGAILGNARSGGGSANPIHPLTFDPEFINAFELGSKNTLFDGSITFNATAFYYDYKGYQISEIVDRTAINLNFDAAIKGAELETTWEPTPGLKIKFAGGYENTRAANGQKSVDLMDRTAGRTDWLVIKPYPSQSSNCILPAYVVANGVLLGVQATPIESTLCARSYAGGVDPITDNAFVANPYANVPDAFLPDYPGFDPVSPNATNNGAGPVPNNGQGFDKDLSGHELPNAPPFTISTSVDYSLPLTPNWAGTFHADYYWQDYSWARIFNDNPYDRIRGYTNVNLALIFTNQDGWQVMGYLKNVFNTTAITGDFLNSDDSGLTTNVFLTDPRLFGLRITKNF